MDHNRYRMNIGSTEGTVQSWLLESFWSVFNLATLIEVIKLVYYVAIIVKMYAILSPKAKEVQSASTSTSSSWESLVSIVTSPLSYLMTRSSSNASSLSAQKKAEARQRLYRKFSFSYNEVLNSLSVDQQKDLALVLQNTLWNATNKFCQTNPRKQQSPSDGSQQGTQEKSYSLDGSPKLNLSETQPSLVTPNATVSQKKSVCFREEENKYFLPSLPTVSIQDEYKYQREDSKGEVWTVGDDHNGNKQQTQQKAQTVPAKRINIEEAPKSSNTPEIKQINNKQNYTDINKQTHTALDNQNKTELLSVSNNVSCQDEDDEDTAPQAPRPTIGQ